MTLLEVLVLVAVMAVTAAILLPSGSRPKASSKRITCVNNLKQVGLALRVFSADHADQWPWQLSGTNGTREMLADPTSAWRHFQSLSNELGSTKIMVCPSDPERSVTPNFTRFQNTNLSYFLGLLADESQPQSIAAGDRNLTTNGAEVGSGRLWLRTNQAAGFSKRIHNEAGNLLTGDGSVMQVTSRRFQEALVDAGKATGNATNQLLIP